MKKPVKSYETMYPNHNKNEKNDSEKNTSAVEKQFYWCEHIDTYAQVK